MSSVAVHNLGLRAPERNRWRIARTQQQPRQKSLPEARDHDRFSSPVVDWAESLLNRLATEVNRDAERSFIQHLRSLADQNTVFPSIASDEDGGIVAVWRSGPLSLQIDVDGFDRFYVVARDRASGMHREWFESPFPTDAVRAHLASLSKRTRAINPSWRALYE